MSTSINRSAHQTLPSRRLTSTKSGNLALVDNHWAVEDAVVQDQILKWQRNSVQRFPKRTEFDKPTGEAQSANASFTLSFT
jgi:hypothetical protein